MENREQFKTRGGTQADEPSGLKLGEKKGRKRERGGEQRMLQSVRPKPKGRRQNLAGVRNSGNIPKEKEQKNGGGIEI